MRYWWATIAMSICLGAYGEGELKLIRKIPHSGYSEGLDYHDKFLWNSLPKAIHKIDPADGTVVEKFIPATEYSESLSWFKGQLWNVAYENNGIFAGVIEGKGTERKLNFKKKGEVPEMDAWGLTHDGKNLIVTGSRGSRKLYFLNPQNGKLLRQIETPISDLEDLAWDGKGLWTSSFIMHKAHIFRVDPKTGNISRLFKIPEPELCPIIDGIAYDGKDLWITGKECPALWLVKMPDEKEIPEAKATTKK